MVRACAGRGVDPFYSSTLIPINVIPGSVSAVAGTFNALASSSTTRSVGLESSPASSILWIVRSPTSCVRSAKARRPLGHRGFCPKNRQRTTAHFFQAFASSPTAERAWMRTR